MTGPTGGVRLDLGDEVVVLRYTTGAFRKLETQTGQPLMVHAARLGQVSIVSLVALVWAGMLHSRPDLTLDDVDDLLPMTAFRDASEAVGRAINLALYGTEEAPDQEEKEGNPEGAPTT